MRVSSHSFAATLVQHLNNVLPASFHLVAKGAVIVLYVDNAVDTVSHTVEILDDDERDPLEAVTTSVESVMSMVQDTIAVRLKAPWPRLDEHSMAMPGVAIEDHVVSMWYGSKRRPIVALESIRLKGLMDSST